MTTAIVTLGKPAVPIEKIGTFIPPNFPPVPSLNTSVQNPESDLSAGIRSLLLPHLENLKTLLNVPFTPAANGLDFLGVDTRIIDSLKKLPPEPALSPLRTLLDYFSDSANVSRVTLIFVGAHRDALEAYAFKDNSNLNSQDPLHNYMVQRGRLEDLLVTTHVIDQRPSLPPDKICFSQGECFVPTAFEPGSIVTIKECDGGTLTLRTGETQNFDQVEIIDYAGPRKEEISPFIRRAAFFMIDADIKGAVMLPAMSGFILGTPPRLAPHLGKSLSEQTPCRVSLVPLLVGDGSVNDEPSSRIPLSPHGITVKPGSIKSQMLFNSLRERERRIARKLSYLEDRDLSGNRDEKKKVFSFRETSGFNYQVSLSLLGVQNVVLENPSSLITFNREFGFLTCTTTVKAEGSSGPLTEKSVLSFSDFIQFAEIATAKILDGWGRVKERA